MSLSMEPTQRIPTDAPPKSSSTSMRGGTESVVRHSLTDAVKRQKARQAEVAVASWLRELSGRQR
jgi:hypothetical protein